MVLCAIWSSNRHSHRSLASMPLQIGDWIGVKTSRSAKRPPRYCRRPKYCCATYVNSDGDYVGLFIAYFRDQKYGSQIHSPRHCLPGGGWVVAGLERVPFDLGVRKITVNRMTIAHKAEVDQMFYWFHTRSGDLTSEYALKFDLVKKFALVLSDRCRYHSSDCFAGEQNPGGVSESG